MRPDSSARHILGSLRSFSEWAAPRMLRPYQVEAGEAIVEAVLEGRGDIFTVCMARQSGKNELSAVLEAYLLSLFSLSGGQIVKAAPSFKPQVVNSQMRLAEVLSSPFFCGRWVGRHGYMVEMGKARVTFFSADPSANIVGATASLLLEVDEAQDVAEDVYLRDLRPMASTTRATTVLYGTPWTDDNILEHQRRLNVAREKETGRRLNFEAPWTVLAAISPPYREFVQGEIERLGEAHPTIRTQYMLQPVSGAGRLFPPTLLRRIRGTHPRETHALPDRTYVMGVDVAGQVADLTARASDARVLNDRDETVVTVAVVEFQLDGGSEEDTDGTLSPVGPAPAGYEDEAVDPVSTRIDGGGLNAPTVRVVAHHHWRGISHAEQYERLLHLIREVWAPQRVCVDGTGVGAGLASFLYRALPWVVEPVIFTAPAKSRMGFALLAAAETGRLRVYRTEGDGEEREFWRQLHAVRYKLNAGEEMAFSVPAAEGHDDFVISLALTVLAAESVHPPSFSGIVRAQPGIDDLSAW